jgi:enamine deaminase RidA (YjgF/YER057c/UK114 family)
MIGRQVLKLGKPFEEQVPFSLGVVSSGRMLYTAGITSRDRNGDIVGEGDIRAQVRQCFSNLSDILVGAGAKFENVVKFTIFTTDIEQFARETEDIRFPYFSGRPAATAVQVSRLIDPRMMVEIEAIVSMEESQ